MDETEDPPPDNKPTSSLKNYGNNNHGSLTSRLFDSDLLGEDSGIVGLLDIDEIQSERSEDYRESVDEKEEPVEYREPEVTPIQEEGYRPETILYELLGIDTGDADNKDPEDFVYDKLEVTEEQDSDILDPNIHMMLRIEEEMLPFEDLKVKSLEEDGKYEVIRQPTLYEQLTMKRYN